MEDSFFGKSPFSSGPLITLQFKHGDPLDVHRALLLRRPKLLALVGNQFPSIRDRPLAEAAPLKYISRSAGHVLVHYLYTDTYGTLKWARPSNGREETVAKLKTALEVYAAARKYELSGLEDLAKEQIFLLSKDLDAFATVAAISEVYPTSAGEDTWFRGFMKTVVKTAFEDSAALLDSEARKSVWGSPPRGCSTAVTLLQSALEAYREIAKNNTAKTVPCHQPADDAFEWRTVAKDEKRKGGHYRFCTWDVAQELVKLVPGKPAPVENVATREAVLKETAAEAAPAIETLENEAFLEKAHLEEPCPEANPQDTSADEMSIAADPPPKETLAVEETEWRGRPDFTPKDIFDSLNPTNMKKTTATKEKKRRSGVNPKPYTKHWPGKSDPTRKPERKSAVVFGNATDSGFFSGSSTTGFSCSFSSTDQATIDNSSTVNSPFTPTTEQEYSIEL